MTGLSVYQSAGAIIAAYRETCDTIRRTFGEIVEAERRLNLALACESKFEREAVCISAHRNGGDRFDDPEGTLKRLRRQVWDGIVARLELRKFLSARAWEALNRDIDSDEMPEIDEETVASFVSSLVGNREAILADAVEEVFRLLRPRGEVYRTNERYEIGCKVILSRVVEKSWGNTLKVQHDRRQELLCVERVFQMLDGRGEINRGHQSEIQTVLEASPDAAGVTPYFSFKGHANGNLHLTFRRADLLAQFNRLAGGKNLKGKHAARDGVGIEVAS